MLSIIYICYSNNKYTILKSLFITLTLVLLLKSLAFSQTEEFKTTYSFGIKQGINYSSVLFNPRLNQGIMLGYNGGLVYKFHNEKLFGLQLELIFSQKGWTEDLDTINNSYSRKLNYLEIPLITQIIFGKRSTKIYVNLGTSFGYLLSESETKTINDDEFTLDYYSNKVDNKFDYSGLGELGTYFNTSFGELQIGIRYQMTLTDLFDSTADSQFLNTKNQVWNLSVTWFFLSNK
jgi:Outer membrane protein beta-barrel domain